MKPTTSLYLDFVRFAASLCIVFHHLNDWTGGAFSFFAPMQSTAVIIFFVLSGFVVAFVSRTKENNPYQYAVSRLARIYSVALPALVMTLVLDWYGKALAPLSYPDQTPLTLIRSFLSGTFFFNQAWTHINIGSNGPYWSLGYEVPYYIAFGLFLFLPGAFRYLGLIAALALFGPRVALLFPIWLMGVVGFAIASKKLISPRIGLALFIVSISAFWLFYVAQYLHLIPTTVVPIYWHHWEILYDYITGILFAISVVALDAFGGKLPTVAGTLQKPIQWIAGATFAIYLFHYPLGYFLMKSLGFTPDSVPKTFLLALIVLGTCFALAEVTERRKLAYRAAIESLLASFTRRHPQNL
jgi:peptidoglycan/LPS O-acetylase OafA/YrhL